MVTSCEDEKDEDEEEVMQGVRHNFLAPCLATTQEARTVTHHPPPECGAAGAFQHLPSPS